MTKRIGFAQKRFANHGVSSAIQALNSFAGTKLQVLYSD